MLTASQGTSASWPLVARPDRREFYNDVLNGLAQSPKRLPCKYLYDRRGSQLFDAICDLPEYYLTRAELQITQQYAPEIAEQVGPHAELIELGSGSSVKTRILLDQLASPAAYLPVDISRKHLYHTAAELMRDYPGLNVRPICADFTRDFNLLPPQEARRTVYFPGSTIGNFTPGETCDILHQIASACGVGGGLLVGIDLQKEVPTIEAAYNDADGITAEFSLNLLRRINRELGADFDCGAFRHFAFYDQAHHRVDIRLISDCSQTVRIGRSRFEFSAGEAIHTEYSYKFTVDGFARLAQQAGFALRCHWTDANDLFALLYLVRTE
jgi:dimethylhistidine N-methyltransferase